MRFKSDVESLTVLVGEGKYCKFINGFFETEAPDEIAALLRAKGVKKIVEGNEKRDEVKKKAAKKNTVKSSKSRRKR